MSPELIRLGPEHRPALSTFSCARYRQPWTEDVELMIRERLADALADGTAEGAGFWVSNELVALNAWTNHNPMSWRSVILAVASGHSRKGYGRRLKQALLDRARAAGAQEVTSLVHRDNESMLKLNEELGADLALDPRDAYRNSMICRIVL